LVRAKAAGASPFTATLVADPEPLRPAASQADAQLELREALEDERLCCQRRLHTMAEEEASWGKTIEEWLTQAGHCCAGGLANVSDGSFYASAPEAGDEGWNYIHKDDFEAEVTDAKSGEKKKVTINEATQLYGFVDSYKQGKPLAPDSAVGETGLWFGGIKYTVTKFEKEEEAGDHTVAWFFAAAPKKGVHICATNGEQGPQIIAGFYNEEKGQTSGNAKKAVLEFAEYLVGLGY